MDLDVPPTLVSFAVTTDKIKNIVSPEFKGRGPPCGLAVPRIWSRRPARGGLPQAGLPDREQAHDARARSWPLTRPTYGGVAEAVLKMTLGNGLGFRVRRRLHHGRAVRLCLRLASCLELTEPQQIGLPLGRTTAEAGLTWQGNTVTVDELLAAYEDKLEPVYACNIDQKQENIGRSPVPRAATAAEAAHQGCQAQGPHPRLPRHQL